MQSAERELAGGDVGYEPMVVPGPTFLASVSALLTKAGQAERLQTVLLSPGKLPLRYGLGILNVNGFLGHNGAILGYGTAMFYLPSANATIVVEGNNNDLSSTVPTTIFVQLAAYLFPKQFPTGV